MTRPALDLRPAAEGAHAAHAHADAHAAVNGRAPRLRAGWISLAVSVVLLVAKFAAWRATGSQTVLSDAMESIVNVAAAAAALLTIGFSARPADPSHPYGHGKIEFLTAGFEGGLIAFAGATILWESAAALVQGHAPRHVDAGIAVVAGAGIVNLVLGLHLIRTGRRYGSPVLEADGHHVLSDSWTSAGAVAGLVLVRLTGEAWIDALTAIVFALLLFRTGARLVRSAARGLLDELDPAVVDEVAAALEAGRRPGIIDVHDLRAINVGDRRHVDLHVVVPEFWTVDQAHGEMDAYEQRVRTSGARDVELQFHVDPCERAYCARCDLLTCPVRAAAFADRTPMTGASVARGTEPAVAPRTAPPRDA